MTLATEEVIREENAFPLRIWGKDVERHLACPYEITLDNFEARFLNGDQKIVHFQVVSAEGNPGFKRHFLYSKADQRRLVTTSGYLFTGEVEVYSWKARDCPQNITPQEREAIEILPYVELFHVSGDKENKTGGLEDAITIHRKRIEGLRIEDITLKDAMKFYNAMKYHVPDY